MHKPISGRFMVSTELITIGRTNYLFLGVSWSSEIELIARMMVTWRLQSIAIILNGCNETSGWAVGI
jgi:hypothetical protein